MWLMETRKDEAAGQAPLKARTALPEGRESQALLCSTTVWGTTWLLEVEAYLQHFFVRIMHAGDANVSISICEEGII